MNRELYYICWRSHWKYCICATTSWFLSNRSTLHPLVRMCCL